MEGWRVRVVAERTENVEGVAPWTEEYSESLGVADDSGLGSISAKDWAYKKVKAIKDMLDDQTVRGGEGIARNLLGGFKE